MIWLAAIWNIALALVAIPQAAGVSIAFVWLFALARMSVLIPGVTLVAIGLGVQRRRSAAAGSAWPVIRALTTALNVALGACWLFFFLDETFWAHLDRFGACCFYIGAAIAAVGALEKLAPGSAAQLGAAADAPTAARH